MDFSFFLPLHSLLRWLVLISLVGTLYSSYHGWIKNRVYTRWDKLIKNTAIVSMYVQVSIGLYLYLNSPIVDYFLNNFKKAVHETVPRFFGMEHITAMTISALMLSTASMLARRKTEDRARFRLLALWITVAFFLIFFSVPWSFSPFTARPEFRPF